VLLSGRDIAHSTVSIPLPANPRGPRVSNLQSEVFEAFRAIDIPEEKALKAATALSRRDDDVLSLKRDMAVLKWMVGTLYPLVLAILVKLFIH
jgi:hypothetical protein